MKAKVTPARMEAFKLLQRVEEDGAFASVLLATQDDALKPSDRALCHELVLGVLRWQLWLDKLAEHYSGRDTATLDNAVRRAIRLGLYQLRFLTRVPESAAVNESVNLAHAVHQSKAAGFVNAVLRRATREPDTDPTHNIADKYEKIAVETSHPRWLIRIWAAQFGLETTKALAAANNSAPPLVFRLGHIIAGRDTLAELQADGAAVTPAALAPDAWRMEKMTALAREFANAGLIYWQDEASQLAAHALNAQAGEKILDLCAAPGSKATLIAARQPAAQVTACDIYPNRLRLVDETATRHGLGNIKTILLHPPQPAPFAPASFDRVLVDAPCSGTGTLRRNPEIRWRIQPANIAELAAQQKDLLQQAAALVKRGGHLVYATCSVEQKENETIAARFAQAYPGFAPVAPDVPAQLVTGPNTARTWPQNEGADGFFIACFRREK